MTDPLTSLELLIGPPHEGARLDRALAELVPDISRSQLQKHIDAGAVSIGGLPPRRGSKTILKSGDVVRYQRPPSRAAVVEAEAIDVPILFEDEAIAVVDKPAGLVVHPGAGRSRGTLVNALIGRMSLAPAAGELRPGIVHRIDRETTGLLIVAKTDSAYVRLRAAFLEREIEKTYLAVCHGMPRPAEATIDTAYGRHPRDRKRFSSRLTSGKRAITSYRVLEPFPGAASVEVSIETGRTHQIRVHFADLGHALVGDHVYGRGGRITRDPRVAPIVSAFGRPALHAHRLALAHPISGAPLELTARIPEDLEALLEALRKVA